jgi:6-phosphogluconolactonase (cycloisomerase 2 family)
LLGGSYYSTYSIEQLVMAPGGNDLYALSPTQQAVMSFTLNSTSGAPTLVPPVLSVGITPDYMILSANGSYLYVLDKAGTTFFPASGNVAAYTTPNIYGFTTSSGGSLTAISNGAPGAPFNENPDATGIGPSVPTAGATSYDTRYLFVANQGSHNISIFKILANPAGQLSEILNSTTIVNGTPVATGSPFDCGSGCTTPSFVTVSNANNGLYLLDTSANKIFQYQINQNTGALRQENPAFVSAEGSPTWITIR